MSEVFDVIETMRVPSNFDYLSQVEGLVDRMCASNKVSDDDYGNVLIAVTEAFNNAITHGNGLDVNKQVEVKVLKGEGEICFSIHDSGNGFDFDNVEDPTAPQNIEKENGRGIYLMRHLAEKVEFENGGREVKVFFKLNG